jgi:hypothetical protein
VTLATRDDPNGVSAHIFSRRDRFKMGGIYAVLDETEMINFVVGRNRADE